MATQGLTREELFALVWEKPTREVAKELGVSDVAIGKLCARLQVPKPPRGYWARVHSGRTPRRPPLAAFREEIDLKRREAARTREAGSLTKLQQQFYSAALSYLRRREVDVAGAELRGRRLPNLRPDIAAQMLLAIQNYGSDWVLDGDVEAYWGPSAQSSVANLVGKLLPCAQPQLLVFESEAKSGWRAENGPVVFVQLTARLQERIAALVRIVRDQKLRHVVMPLVSTDCAWSARHLYVPDTRLYLDSTLCISSSDIWVECTRKAWREEDPPERVATGKIELQSIMPIDYMPHREVELPPVISRAVATPYRDRVEALLKAENVHEMMTHATYSIEREVPDETLAVADRIWFGSERPFLSARQALNHLEDELERWELELEAARSDLAQSILGIKVGDIVTTQTRGRLVRLLVTDTRVYATDEQVTFIVSGTRFRKDGTLGKLQDAVRLYFEDEDASSRT